MLQGNLPTDLAHSRNKKWQELGDSNPRPSVLETDALPTELNSCSPNLSARTTPFTASARQGQATYSLKTHLVINLGQVALPFAMIMFEQTVRQGLLAGDDFTQRIEEAAFIIAAAVQAVSGG
jgi:hypothetical protein